MTAPIIPVFQYKDAPAAIEWLCKAFGFEKHLVVPDEKGGIAHAELKFGDSMIMLGSVRDSPFGRLLRRADNGVTQSCYVVVSDVNAHHDRAKAAGAEIVVPLTDQDYGGRDYTCRDPEGHVWAFGTYGPTA